jgi:hypothetical protein
MSDPTNIIFTPHEVGLAGYNAAKRAIEFQDVGIPLRIKNSAISEYFADLLPWEICAIQGQTHNGKTMFMDWWERKTVETLNEKGQEGDIVHVSHEESIEAMAFTEYGRLLDVLPATLARGEFKDLGKLEIAMQTIDACRIWRIAESAERPDEEQLTLSNIYRALAAMQTGIIAEERKIRLIALDYLQAMPIDPEVKQVAPDAQRRLQVRNDVYRLRNMTVHLKSPILVAVQCKQKLEGANPPYEIPGIYDGEETSSIAQRFDRIISLWMPKTSKPVGTVITWNNEPVFTVTEDMVFAKVNKQRGGLPSGKTFELRIDYKTREYVDAYEKRKP